MRPPFPGAFVAVSLRIVNGSLPTKLTNMHLFSQSLAAPRAGNPPETVAIGTGGA